MDLATDCNGRSMKATSSATEISPSHIHENLLKL